ncbi:alpha/beta fold hydrolase [Kineococcus arenarius]|uniref:alpha/beta fold hydrolase n=1 Tax=Kineococcus sp. SYSU DK007 TaxID=3383128 RepID=UPI003D7E6467
MKTTTAQDGTTLAYEQVGEGPALVFVPGAFNLRDTCAPIAAQLADAYTCFTYDRRARGESSNTPPYAIEREVEDLRALLEVAGGRAAVFGYSSGAVLALRAAADGLPINRLFLYEPPFRFEDEAATAPPPAAPAADLPERLQRMVDEGRTAEVVSTFQLEGIGLPPQVVEGIQRSALFPRLQAIAQSVVHDATITAVLPVPTPAMAAVQVPTLVLRGARTWPLLATAAQRLAALLPNAELHVLLGAADHGLEPVSTAAAIRRIGCP